MRSLFLIGSLIGLLMYVGFAAQQAGATATGGVMRPAVAPVHVPSIGQGSKQEAAAASPEAAPRRVAPLAFLTAPKDSCAVATQGAPTNAGR